MLLIHIMVTCVVHRNLCIAWWKWCFHCFGPTWLSAQLKTLYCSCLLPGSRGNVSLFLYSNSDDKWYFVVNINLPTSVNSLKDVPFRNLKFDFLFCCQVAFLQYIFIFSFSCGENNTTTIADQRCTVSDKIGCGIEFGGNTGRCVYFTRNSFTVSNILVV